MSLSRTFKEIRTIRYSKTSCIGGVTNVGNLKTSIKKIGSLPGIRVRIEEPQ